jgi:hypothetical protein
MLTGSTPNRPEPKHGCVRVSVCPSASSGPASCRGLQVNKRGAQD